MKYPDVLSEVETLKALHAGASIARYGDGELKLIRGANCISQIYDRDLGRDLGEILRNPGKCLVGIPNLNSPTPKAPGWAQYKRSPYVDLLSPKVAYVSSFITRPDSAPWIDTPDYWASVTDLWRGRDIVLVKGTERSLRLGMMAEASSVEEMPAPPRDAYVAVGGLFEALKRETRRVLLCLGPAATVLAWRLAQEGVQALDVGHLGMTMRRAGQYGAAQRPVTFKLGHDDFRFEISDRAAEYLAVQKLGFESYQSRAAWKDAYQTAIFEAYENMAAFLPEKCESLLDIGSGLGGIDALLNRHYRGAVRVHVVDGDDDEPIVKSHAETFNSKAPTLEFLVANGVKTAIYCLPDNLTLIGKMDLIISTASWCFHYPPETYLDFVKSCCRKGTVLILEVRRNKPEWFVMLARHFKPVATAGVFAKFERRVYEF